jgi:hypothetical protein
MFSRQNENSTKTQKAPSTEKPTEFCNTIGGKADRALEPENVG